MNDDDDGLFEAPATPELDPRLRIPLLHDLAYGLHEPEDLGRRFNLGGEEGLKKFLRDNPEFRKEAQTLRALKKSNVGVPEMGRTMAGHASIELVSDMAGIAADPKHAAAVRIDAFKQLNRMAGIDGVAVANRNSEAAAGSQFNLVINLPDGRTERLTTIVEPPTAALPAPDDSEE